MENPRVVFTKVGEKKNIRFFSTSAGACG